MNYPKSQFWPLASFSGHFMTIGNFVPLVSLMAQVAMGLNPRGDRGDTSPHIYDWGDAYINSAPHFLSLKLFKIDNDNIYRAIRYS